jgi:hypothetical protein
MALLPRNADVFIRERVDLRRIPGRRIHRRGARGEVRGIKIPVIAIDVPTRAPFILAQTITAPGSWRATPWVAGRSFIGSTPHLTWY